MDRFKLDHLTADPPVDRRQLNKENTWPGTKLWAVNPKGSEGLASIFRGGLQHFPDSWRKTWEVLGPLNTHKVGG